MITIIVGALDSGKSTKMTEIFRQKGGDGFVSSKRFDGEIFTGYDLVRLTTEERIPLARVLPSRIDGFEYGRFIFSKKAFDYAERIYREIIAARSSPIFIDEIGRIELDGRGFDNIFRRLVLSEAEIYFCARDAFLEKIVEAYRIRNPRIQIILQGGNI